MVLLEKWWQSDDKSETSERFSKQEYSVLQWFSCIVTADMWM